MQSIIYSFVHYPYIFGNRNVMNTYGRYPLTISHGKGCKLYDSNGKEYLDFAAGIATCILGHANPALKKAVSEQMDKVMAI